MENLNLKKQERSFLSFNRTILSIIFAIILVVLTIVSIINFEGWIELVIALLLIIPLYLIIFIYQGAAYKHFNYAMNEFGLYINKGVFWRRKIIVPRNRVQHTDVVQGPIERKLKLAELIVHTAGTRNASVKLPGILRTDAEKLRESLSFEESNDAV
jgi:membrane protein YdbS with pleckstrin-like domain